MGYYIETTGCNFLLKKENFHNAYQLMCELNNHDELKSGGMYPEQKEWTGKYNPSKWFSWMPYNYPETTTTMEEILTLLGFENLSYNENGDLIYLSYYSKIGNEEQFFKVIAPLIEDGSYIDWRGEDGENWRWYFSNGQMIMKNGHIVFD